MIITKKRIRSLDLYLGSIKVGQKFYVGISDTEANKELLKKIGFTKGLQPNTSVLPAIIGPVTRFNAEGRQVKRKDLPMETAYRIVEWHWTEWHGKDSIEKSDFKEVPYNRYQRDFISPSSVELTLTATTNGDLILVSPMLEKTGSNDQDIIAAINVVLEIFKQCEIFTEDLSRIITAPIQRLNWKILPEGEMPWKKMQTHLTPLVEKASKGNQPVIENRLETINKYTPDFAAIGDGGFSGYVIFGFKEKNVYTLESIYYGNATYVFGEAWEDLSKKTKAEILDNNLQKARIVHRNGWHDNIEKLLAKKATKTK
jgi:hypothetical protein